MRSSSWLFVLVVVVGACGGIAVVDPPSASGSGGDGGGSSNDVGSSASGSSTCTITGPLMCTTCAGQACDLLSCCDQPGCLEVVQCALDTGCTGFDCLGPCGDEIDAAGGSSSPAVTQAIIFGDCAAQSCGC